MTSRTERSSKIAVVLLNLGGPDSPAAVRPFLQNLFRDPAIIGIPAAIRYPLSWLIARKRAPVAQEIYQHLGGQSPLLPNTQAQAAALQQVLEEAGITNRVFIAMRYWHPFAAETVAAVKAYQPDKIILLPLYPQFSTTTTGSSVDDWYKACDKAGLNVPTVVRGCYPCNPGWVNAVVATIRQQCPNYASHRLLFSAHGLPEKIVKGGDPYQAQVEASVQAVVAALGDVQDYVACYQSRVGPLQWIKPATEAEIVRAGTEKKGVVLIPIAFVSEHSETLVELDIEYRELAAARHVPVYHRINTVQTHSAFIAGLADEVQAVLGTAAPDRSILAPANWYCGTDWQKCRCLQR